MNIRKYFKPDADIVRQVMQMVYNGQFSSFLIGIMHGTERGQKSENAIPDHRIKIAII